MTVKVNRFEGGSDETAITTGNSGGDSGDAFDSPVQNATFDTARASHGSVSGRLSVAGTSSAHVTWSTTGGTWYTRIYLYMSAAPPANLQLIKPMSSTTIRAAVRILTGRTVQISSSALGDLGTSTTVLATGQWHRIEALFTQGGPASGLAVVRIYTSADSTTITETLTASSTTISSWDRLRYAGDFSGAQTYDLWVDGLGASDSDWLGPYVQTVSPSAISSAEAFGTSAVTAGAVTLSPGGIASGEAFGTAVITPGTATVSPSGIASAEAHGTTTVTPGALTVSPSGIGSSEAFGTAQLDIASSPEVQPAGIASAEAFGTATVTPGEVAVTPDGVASSEAFGTASIVPGGVSVSPVSIASGEAFGLTNVGLRQRAVFRPPVVEEGSSGAGRLFNRVKLRRALTVLRNHNGSYSTVRYPPLVQIENSAAAYLGGHEYVIDGPTVVELTAAGYGDLITLE